MILCGSVVSYAKGFSPSKRVARHFHICNQISSVENIDDYFVVHLSKEQQSDNSLSYIQYFGYSGRSLDANIFFPPNSAHSCYLNGTDLYINFILPFVSEYTGHLTCWDKAKLDIDHVSPQKEDNKYLMKKFDANISIKVVESSGIKPKKGTIKIKKLTNNTPNSSNSLTVKKIAITNSQQDSNVLTMKIPQCNINNNSQYYSNNIINNQEINQLNEINQQNQKT